MFHVLPLAVAVTVALLGVALSLRCSEHVYTSDSRYSPYDDLGFQFLPYLAPAVRWLLPMYGAVHSIAFVMFYTLHEHRITILRRFLMLFGAATVLQECQNLCTTLPNPNTDFLRDRRGIFDMYPAQFTLAALTAAFYVEPAIWRWMWIASWFVGLCVVIATHFAYSVDTILACVPPTLLFLLYHWYCRSELAILKRNLVYWFERDVFLISTRTVEERAVHARYRPVLESARIALESPLHLRARAFLNDWTMDEFALIPRSWNVFVLDRLGEYKMYSSSVVFAVTDGRGPSQATLLAPTTVPERDEIAIAGGLDSQIASPVEADTMDPKAIANRALHELQDDPGLRIARELAARADTLPEDVKRNRPRIVSIACFIVGVLIGTLNLIPIQYADAHRPLNVTLPADILHDNFPKLPDHTADIFLYIIIAGTVLFSAKSRFSWVILHRIGIMYGGSMTLRLITMISTQVPDPSPTCVARQHPRGTTCGDLIYSGHTVAYMMCAFTFRYFTKELVWGGIAWMLTFSGLFCVIVSRLHYTKDVMASLFVIATVNHLARVMLFKRVSFVRDNAWAWLIESGYYIVLSDDIRRHVATTDQKSDVAVLQVDTKVVEVSGVGIQTSSQQ